MRSAREEFESTFASRRATYKRGVTLADGRRARAASTVAVRKEKRAAAIQKKRRQAQVGKVENSGSTELGVEFEKHRPKEVHEDKLQEYGEALSSSNDIDVYCGVYALRKLLAREEKPPTEDVVQAGLAPRLVELLSHPQVEICFEASWAITNIASTEYTQYICELGAIPPLVDLLVHEAGNVREQAIWCLGNVAGDGSSLRDQLLSTPGAVANLIRNVEHPESESLLRNAMWALANLCRNKPLPSKDAVEDVLAIFVRALHESEDVELLPDVLWGLSYLTDADPGRISAVVDNKACGPDTDVCKRMVEMLDLNESSVTMPALRAVGNVCTGSDDQTQQVVAAGILPRLTKILRHGKRNARREACWMASNIAAGTKDQMAALVATPGMLQALLHQMSEGEWNVRKEAAWAVSNLATQARPEDVRSLVSAGALEPMSRLLTVDDARILHIMLESIEAILKVGKLNDDAGAYPGTEDYIRILEESDGLTCIEDLQDHKDQKIYRRALSIIRNYIGEDEDETAGPPEEAHLPSGGGDDAMPPVEEENDAPPAPSSRFGSFGKSSTSSGFSRGGGGGFGKAAAATGGGSKFGGFGRFGSSSSSTPASKFGSSSSTGASRFGGMRFT